MNKKTGLDMVMKNMDPDRATKILAKSFYKEMKKNGFANRDIIRFSREVVECMAMDMFEPGECAEESKKVSQLIG
ncbi:MAG: hypothetical protein U9P80_02370 [Thermodesulfobacteriota bacterium]|nr:hypothetical protein [Thermodesulfobacteriota bacterium]